MDPFHRTSHRSALPVVTLALLLATACGPRDSHALAHAVGSESGAAGDTRVIACSIMPKAELNALIGSAYTLTEATDDGRSSETGCQYKTEADPAGTSLDISWIAPSEYSDPVEHAALQKAGMAGARLGGKLTAGMTAGGLPGVHDGPVAGVGDEATQNLLLLTARKGDYLVTVQIFPSDISALMTDSTAGPGIVEKEKAIARRVFEKL